MTKAPRDIAASVRARLLLLAKSRGEDFQLVLTRYANERLLYRLSKSQHAGSFVLANPVGRGGSESEQVDITRSAIRFIRLARGALPRRRR